MDDRRFDDWARRLGGSRRSLLKKMFGLGGAAAVSRIAVDDAEAARRGYGGVNVSTTGPRYQICYQGCCITCVDDQPAHTTDRFQFCIDRSLGGCDYCASWASPLCSPLPV